MAFWEEVTAKGMARTSDPDPLMELALAELDKANVKAQKTKHTGLNITMLLNSFASMHALRRLSAPNP
jgi:hypothetical protein